MNNSVKTASMVTLLLAKTDKVNKSASSRRSDPHPGDVKTIWFISNCFRVTIGTKASLFNWVLYFYFLLWTWILSKRKSGCYRVQVHRSEKPLLKTSASVLAWSDRESMWPLNGSTLSLSGYKQMRFASGFRNFLWIYQATSLHMEVVKGSDRIT